jgi:hypothetical protein
MFFLTGHYQAFCPLYRIGQEKDVQIVKVIVQNTIDDYILQLQTKKSADINSTIGEEALQKRDTIVGLHRMFVDIEVQENGARQVQQTVHEEAKTGSEEIQGE